MNGMKYQCPSCKNRFSFRDKISFCPYCGANLASADIGAVVGQDSPLAESMESFFSKKDEKIADIEKTVRDYVYWQSIVSISKVFFPDSRFAPFDFDAVYKKCLESRNKKDFFSRIFVGLDDLKNTIKTVYNAGGADFNEFYMDFEQTDKNVSDALTLLGRSCKIKPFDVINLEFRHNSVASKEELLCLQEKLTALAEKIDRYVCEHNLYLSNFGVEYSIGRNFFENTIGDGGEENADEYRFVFEKTVEKIKNVSEKEYVYDFFSDSKDVDEMMSAFWNGFYRAGVFVNLCGKTKCFCDGKPCDAIGILKHRIELHYADAENELERAKNVLRKKSNEKLTEIAISVKEKLRFNYEVEYERVQKLGILDDN